jgi:uncharacterized protein YlaI
MSESEHLTRKLHRRRSENYETYIFFCPGCNEGHDFATKHPNFAEPWTFNGDIEKPTFSPSLLMVRSKADYEGCGPRCHSFVTDGKIHYCQDCEHELAGKTVDMVDIPEWYGT